jgi:hypothetical protein
MLLEQGPTSLLFLPASLLIGSPAFLVGSMPARNARLLPRPVLGALLLDAHLNEPTLLLAEFDDCRSRVLALVLALSEFPAAHQDRLWFAPISVEVQRRDGKHGSGLRLFRFLDLRSQFGQQHLGLLAPRIKAGVLSEPLLKSPDRLEPLARVLRLTAERPEAAFQRFELSRGVELSQLSA